MLSDVAFNTLENDRNVNFLEQSPANDTISCSSNLLTRISLEATSPSALEDHGAALGPLVRLLLNVNVDLRSFLNIFSHLVLVERQVGAGGGRGGSRGDRGGAGLGGGGVGQGEDVVVVVEPLVARAGGEVHQDHRCCAFLHIRVLGSAEEPGPIA